jgi:hypothetical protein
MAKAPAECGHGGTRELAAARSIGGFDEGDILGG